MKKFVVPMIANKSLLPVYVYSVGGMANQSRISRENGYAEFIWLHTVKGKGRLVLEGAEYVMKPGMGMLVYPGSAHHYEAVEEPWETHWVAFNGPGVRPLLQLSHMNRSELFTLCNTRLLERHIHDIYTAAIMKTPDMSLKTSGKLYGFLVDLPACVAERMRPNSPAGALLERALDYMERHYAGGFSLEELAASIGVTHQYVCRIFKQTMQMTPGAYLTKLRLQKAKELLIGTRLSVAETGKSVGFHDSSYFCHLFRHHEGVTPSEYRRNYR
ncbi:AraC family transcriptional regulator [Paenibacillus sp. GYB003]|uniref:AraC family transcriptional regulator n=1 Tax=Paenibacillus sp. GYB003 TaxID=2994392 RepID=UPI002F967A00